MRFLRSRPRKTRFYGVFRNQHPEKPTDILFDHQMVTILRSTTQKVLLVGVENKKGTELSKKDLDLRHTL